ncbi:MAG: AAA family ATPase [Bacteroidota bacterium]|nr:AAA family ATPase [Bacteroidota bacterium]
MRIKNLWVSRYKNLEDIYLEFNSDLVTLLVGQNGLGKSNLIEILAMIFRDLDLMDKKEDYEAWPYEKNHFEYAICYTCRSNEIKIDLRKGSFHVYLNGYNDNYQNPITFKDFINNRDEHYLPKFILGYYSGENKRIKEIISKHESKQKNTLRNWQRKPSKEEIGLRRLFFTENFHSQLILLTLALYRRHDAFNKKLNVLFDEFLGIVKISDFKITFNNPNWNYTKIDSKNKGMDYLISNINESLDYPFWNVKGKVDALLTRFYNEQIETSEPIYFQNDSKNKDSVINEFLEFNNIEFDRFADSIIEYYEHPVEFFDALESSSIIGILNKITIQVQKFGIDEPIDFSHLSEGEQQLITVLGLTLITGKEDCLFLLDEPDTHLNPLWQRNYVNLLEEFDLNEKNSHFVVATHSPLIVQSSEKADVFLFKKNNNEILIDTTDHQLHNWRIDQVLVSEYFNLPTARPVLLDSYMELRESILSKSKLSESDIENLKSFENEFGVLPTGETVNDINAMLLIRKITNKAANDQA